MKRIILMGMGLMVALMLPACKEHAHHFEERQQDQSSVGQEQPSQTAIPTDGDYRYEVTLASGKVIRAKTVSRDNCGVELKGTDDGLNYQCLQNVSYKELPHESCSCSGGGVILFVILVFLFFLFMGVLLA